jgi:hypothetical protein
VLVLDERVFVVQRTSPDGNERALCLHNVSDAPVSLRLPDAVPSALALPRGQCNVSDRRFVHYSAAAP